MQWSAERLPDEAFYSTLDDDFFVDLQGLASSIHVNIDRRLANGWPDFPIVCGYVRGVGERPVRRGEEFSEKWAMPNYLFKWSVYPPYCHGGIYSTSVSVVKQLFYLSQSEPIWHLDDVWITGILRWKLGFPDEMLLSTEFPVGVHLDNYIEDDFSFVESTVEKVITTFYSILETDGLCKCYR